VTSGSSGVEGISGLTTAVLGEQQRQKPLWGRLKDGRKARHGSIYL
jgi:hypothetical protein